MELEARRAAPRLTHTPTQTRQTQSAIDRGALETQGRGKQQESKSAEDTNEAGQGILLTEWWQLHKSPAAEEDAVL